MPRLRPPLLVAAAVAALALPASAHAGQSYVVKLAPPPETTCERTILDVTVQYSLTPTTYHTAVGCGFSASLSRAQVRTLSADPRVVSVTLETAFSTTTG